MATVSPLVFPIALHDQLGIRQQVSLGPGDYCDWDQTSDGVTTVAEAGWDGTYCGNVLAKLVRLSFNLVHSSAPPSPGRILRSLAFESV